MDRRFDLSVDPPRPGTSRLGDWAWLPRMIDKARATYHGNPGTFSHPCSRDRVLLTQLGISVEEFRDIIDRTRSDQEVLAEVHALRNRKTRA